MKKSLTGGMWAPLTCMAILSMTGCGGDSSSVATYTVGGAVSGLSADEDVTLVNNGGEALTVVANGGFRFSPGQALGSTYDVTVKSHMPGIACSVNNGTGAVAASNVTSVGVSCAAGGETILHSFAERGYDGGLPGGGGGLLMDNAGNFYGTTYEGGEFDGGTVFEITPTGTETVVYSFADSPLPVGQLVMDVAGNIYGTTFGGGADSAGTVFKIDPTTGTESIVYSFTGGTSTTDGAGPIGLLMDAAGNLYGTTSYGGAYGYGTVFRISPNGVEIVLHSFAGGPTDGANPSAGVTMDHAGNLYGTTSYGGAYGHGNGPDTNGTVFRISATGVETVLHSFAGGFGDGVDPGAGLIIDSDGNLYGTTPNGGEYSGGTVFKIDPRTAEERIVHSFDCPPPATDGCAPLAGLIIDSVGNLYGTTADGGMGEVGTAFKINPTTGKETVLYSFVSTVGSNDGTVPLGRLVMDGAGNLYGTTSQGGVYALGTVFRID